MTGLEGRLHGEIHSRQEEGGGPGSSMLKSFFSCYLSAHPTGNALWPRRETVQAGLWDMVGCVPPFCGREGSEAPMPPGSHVLLSLPAGYLR